MKTVQHYICEICGTEYNNKDRAIDCEKGHCTPVKIKSARYLPYNDNRKGYPISIEVEMADGKIVTYKKQSGEKS